MDRLSGLSLIQILFIKLFRSGMKKTRLYVVSFLLNFLVDYLVLIYLDSIFKDTWSPGKSSHQSCGAPLGLRFHPENPDMLYTTDAYYGIVKVNVKTRTKQVVLSLNDTRFNEFPMKFPDDLDIDGDIIYFIDSSYEHEFNEALEEHIEALPRGRLFAFNEKTGHLELLVANLYFPNGLQLMPNKNEILINENTMSRIIK